ncbi:PH domain-containing protein [Agrilutibacter solisilvae]|uniref:PH domain-containing protein n=1 Tax=Agrilutibacter solisilvae TaxID=2763317 RepID=A0A974Y2A2_9GAMM|nr:PH domain-containing protein [Lysobacter solisilvae]QSX79918.1 PH domain-containing protein [Lysobacter solisilvae]
MPEATAADAERRLHPMSWLFVLLQQLKQFILPLVAAFFFGGDRNELWPLIGVGVLALMAVWRYFTYRYGIAGDALVVRSGLLERSLRVIPFARIHNVALEQSLLHRVFGVAEVRLESAGGKKPEAEMRVLKMADALALEALVRRRGSIVASPADATSEQAPTLLLALPPGEVLRVGLVSNRGLIVVGAAIGGLSQFRPRLLPNLVEQWGQSFVIRVSDSGVETAAPSLALYAIAGVSLVALAVLALRVFSVLLALLQYHGFRLTEHARRLTVERGLLARWRTSASRGRIQAWTLREGMLHRLLGRRSLEVDTAVAEQQNQQRALRELAPIGTPAQCEALILHVLPRSGWTRLEWDPVPMRHWWRLWIVGLPFVGLAAAALTWQFGPVGLLALLWLPWSAYAARRHMASTAHATGDQLVAVREGWWHRTWRFAELDKLQALELSRGPLDRLCGTATLWLDTSGAAALAPPLRLRFLAHEQAQALHARLARTLARRPLR